MSNKNHSGNEERQINERTSSESNGPPSIDPDLIDENTDRESPVNFERGNPDQFNTRYEPARHFAAKCTITKSESTAKIYDSHLRQYVDYLAEFDDLTPELAKRKHIFSYLLFLGKKYKRARSTLQGHRSTIKMLHEFMREYDNFPNPKTTGGEIARIDLDEVVERKRTFERESIPRDEIELLFEEGNPRDELLARVLYETGIRNDDAKELQLGDINFGKKYITIYDSKGGKDYNLPIREDLAIRINVYSKTARKSYPGYKSSDHLFLSQKGEALSNGWITDIIAGLAEDVGIQEYIGEEIRTTPLQPNHEAGTRRHKRVTPHTLRHSIVTHLSEEDVPQEVQKHLTGHDSDVIEDYDHSGNLTAFDILRDNII